MSTLEDRLRSTLRDGPAPYTDGLAERVLARIEVQRKRRRVAAMASLLALGLASAVAAGAWVASSGSHSVTSVPAAETSRRVPGFTGNSPRPHTPPPAFITPDSVAAYLAAQENWADCLREHGVRVSGPDENHNYSVNPDPDLETQRDACTHLAPALSDYVELQLQAEARAKAHFPFLRESGPRAPLGSS